MWQLGTPPLELVARTIIIYVVFFGALRLAGKRELGQVTLFDLALVLLVANALQPAMTGPDNSVTGGVIIIVTIFALNRCIAWAREQFPIVRHALEFNATVIGRDGAWLPEAIKREGLDQTECDAALREHGFADVAQLKLATLEPDGSISIIAYDRTPAARARRRYRHARTG